MAFCNSHKNDSLNYKLKCAIQKPTANQWNTQIACMWLQMKEKRKTERKPKTNNNISNTENCASGLKMEWCAS